MGEVGTFDPLRHESMQSVIEEGERVKVVACGYSRGDRLLYRARVVRVD
ncbi:MAG: nucleotide exchange factor GrpE [Alkalinema sp. RU_4_3]|nr:nucleotide exchange factor GrpE [Alkalinema sp. RU_4_3]